MQQARIRLSSTQLPALKGVCEQIESVCKNQGIRKLGPIPLPTKRLRVPVMKAPSGQGTSTWAKFEMRIHKRLIDIFEPTSDLINALMELQLPAGVEVEIKQ